MNLADEKIKNIILETVENNGFFLIELVLRGNPNNRLFEVFIDGDVDVSAESCAFISREINSKLEELVVSSYRLDVSSPGVDRPLKYLKQFPKNINRNFEVLYTENEPGSSEPAGGSKKFTGKLTAVEGDELVFLVNKINEKRINFNNIKKAKVIISFS